MKIAGKVTKVKDNYIAVSTDFDRWKIGEHIVIKRGKTRSLEQNAFYWLYLNWVINHGLKDQGHFSPEGLHEDLKAYFLSEKKLDKGFFKVIESGSTTQLNKPEFSEYMDSVDKFITSFFGIDTSEFFSNYEKNHALTD